jgi:hypothetical protein
LNLDYRRRESVSVYEGATPGLSMASTAENSQSVPENLLVGSAVVKVYDLLRLIASVGQEVTGKESATRVAGGVSLINQQFNFSYQAMRPNTSVESVHHAVALGLEIAM